MKLLKRISIILSATLLLWGCSESDEPVNETNVTLSLSTNEIKVNGLGDEIPVTVTSSGDWRLAGTYDWAHPSITSGKSGDEVIFKIEPNSLNKIRTATFKFFVGSTVVPLEVECTPMYTVNPLTGQELNIPRTASNIAIKAESNIPDELTIIYSDETCKEWLTFEKQSKLFVGKTTLSFEVTANKTYKSRSAQILLESPFLAEPATLTITQDPVPYFTVSPNTQTLEFDLAENTLSFEIKTNIEYTPSIVNGAEWITEQKITEPQIDEEGLASTTLSYKLLPSTKVRVGSIRIENSVKNAEFTICQIDPNAPKVSISNSTIRDYALEKGWIASVGDAYILTDAGTNATEFITTSSLSNLNGLENFPNLNTISIGTSTSLKKVDITKLHNVTSFTITGNTRKPITEFKFGDNPISSFKMSATYIDQPKITFIGTQLQEIDINLSSPKKDYDTEVIDISQCPSLQILKYNGKYVNTLYLKTGQTVPTVVLGTDDYEIKYK